MIKTFAYDVEVLPNFFSITFVNVNDYLDKFKDSCTIEIKKGKEKRNPIPLVQKYKVEEIKNILDTVEQFSFYITDEDDSQLLPMLGFINGLSPYKNENGIAIRYDLFGYNTNSYDKLMVAALLMYYNQYTCKELIKKLYQTSKHIIDIQRIPDAANKDFIIDNLRKFALPFINVDVMTIFALNKATKGKDENGKEIFFPKSLKQTSINLQWYEILEHELPPISDLDRHYYDNIPKYDAWTLNQLNNYIDRWDRYIISDWIPGMMHYNKNDVYIVCEMIRLFIDEIRLRYNISSSYGVNVLSSSRSNIADKLFIKFYSEFSNLNPNQWRGKKTDRTIMSLNKVIFPFINFKTKELQDLLTDIKKLKLTSIGKEGLEYAIKDEKLNGVFISSLEEQSKQKVIPGINVKINNLDYTIATGGLHSKDIPRELKSKIIKINNSFTGNEDIWQEITDDSYIYIHWDISSFYPSIMDVYKIAPEHLDVNVFSHLIHWLKETRVKAKHSEEEYIDGIPKDILAQALKIVINSIYGKLGFEYGDIYDRMAVLKVTINGQLMILMLCEELELNGIEVVSANTDGIVVKLYKDKKPIFDKISNNWKELTKLDADSEEYNCYINRDINNYIVQELNGKITFKGALNPKMYLAELTKGYDMPIVAEAVYQFFINNVPVLETLYNCRNILDFCKTQNVANTFEVAYKDATGYHKTQKNIRFYVSNEGVSVVKISKADDKVHSLCANEKVVILNTLDDKPIEFRNIKYQYYYEEAYKIINPIKLGISPKTAPNKINRTLSGKKLIKKYSGQFKSLFDDNT